MFLEAVKGRQGLRRVLGKELNDNLGMGDEKCENIEAWELEEARASVAAAAAIGRSKKGGNNQREREY